MINFPIHNYPKDQVIFKEGTTGNVAFIIKEGTAEISIEGESGKLILAELHPGDIFGEMALFLKENKRTATAVALEDCELIAIYKNFFMDYLKECPAVVVTLINSLIQRLQETSIRLSQSKSLVIEIDEILQLLVKHNVMAINYDEIINTFCRCTGAEADVIATQLKYMEKLGHLQIEEDRNNQTVIRLPYRKI